MKSPYSDLPDRAFWRKAVSESSTRDPGAIYEPRFPIGPKTRIATAGSCFAQHVGRALREAAFNVLDAEPIPASVSDTTAQAYGYRLFSGRYGNIYTARQMLQLLREALGEFEPADPVWARGDRYFDAQRPNIEPEGFASEDQVRAHRKSHLAAILKMFRSTDLFVFTFGLTEAWTDRASGTVYPTAPGTIAGTFDQDRHIFRNFGFEEVHADFLEVRAILRRFNPDMRFVVTTSPVPLTATASGLNVEVATCYSKAVLRAVCGSLYAAFDDVDYFPSYEIITSVKTRGAYFGPNLRSVTPEGVGTAMRTFLAAHGVAKRPGDERSVKGRRGPGARAGAKETGEVCEEALLDAFAK